MFKNELDYKKLLSYIIFFIIIFSVSIFVMKTLKMKTEKEYVDYYTKQLEKSKTEAKVISQEPLRMIKKIQPDELGKYVDELKQRIDLYKKKNDLLNRKEKELESFKADLEIRKNELVSIRRQISDALELISKERLALDSDLITFNEIERKNLKNLSTVYASMEAPKAAKVLSQLNSETSAKVLTGMPSKKSAKILVEITPAGAAKLTDQMKNLEITRVAKDGSLKQDNLKKLAKIYQDMDAAKAVIIIEELDEETTVNILSYMDEKKLAKILNLVETERASILTEKIKNKTKQINIIKGA